MRALQDWFLKYELKTVPDVAEVATVGGMVKQYQVVLDPARLKAYNLPVMKVIAAIRDANREFGGSVLELAEAEYMVRVKGYLRSLDDFRRIPVKASEGGTPVLLADIARIQLGPEMRRGIAELDGEGEVVGGVVVLRSGKNAWAAIQAVKAKLAQLKPGLPEGVEIVETYDRSALIERAVTHLRDKLAEEFAVVAIVCLAFLLHLRSALVAVVSLPLGVLGAFIVMRAQGVNADIMSLGGIAIAVGAMVDAAIVMVENAHKKLEAWRQAQPAPAGGGRPPEPPAAERWRLIVEASVEVGPALFFSPADHHAVVRPGVRARSAGGPDVQAAGVHQDVCDGRVGAAGGHARAGADGLRDPRAHSGRARQSAQPLADRRLPAAVACRVALAEDDAGTRRAGPRGDRVSGAEAGRRIHAAARRRRPAVHADRAAGPVRGQGERAPAADGPDDQTDSRGEDASSARSGAPRRRPIPRRSK